MVALERWMALFNLLSSASSPNDEQGLKWQSQANASFLELMENYYRIERLATLAPSKGSAAKAAATKILESTEKASKTRRVPLGDLRLEIDAFNHAVREAHAEMLASRAPV
jgi:hypothetical protein